MKPLQKCQRMLMWLKAFPTDESVSYRNKVTYIVVTLSVIMGHILSVASSSLSIYQTMSVDLEATLFALFHTITSTSMIYQSIVSILLCHDLATIFVELSTIYKKRKYKMCIFKRKNILSCIIRCIHITWCSRTFEHSWGCRFLSSLARNEWEMRMDCADVHKSSFGWFPL